MLLRHRLQLLYRSLAAILLLLFLVSLLRPHPGRTVSERREPEETDVVISKIKLTEEPIDSECACRGGNSKEYNFCFSVKVNGSTKKGQKFDCKWLSLLEKLNIHEPQAVSESEFVNPIFATGSSSNHLAEAKSLIVSIQKRFGNTSRILFYDLGLQEGEAAEMKAACNVEYRKFSFEAYPDSVRVLRTFRWKTLLIAELQQEFSTFWWADSSVRWLTGNLSEVYDAVSEGRVGSYLTVDKAHHSMFAATHPNMYKFLPINEEKAQATMMYGGGFVLFHRSPTSVAVLKWLVLCAMEDACINPPDAKLDCQFVDRENWKLYANCHRYDQSAVNVILGGLNDYNDALYSTKTFQEFAQVRRGDYNDGQLTKCIKT